MRILFLAPANNYHTKKWCHYFSDNGHDVHVISLVEGNIENVKVHFIDTGASTTSSDFKKLKYFTKILSIHRLIKEIAPDVINAHYASSYGAIAALTCFQDYYLSVWGSDVYDFPQKSVFHKILLKFSLERSKYLFSTSYAMAKEIRKYTRKAIEVTPFGVDMDLFSPNKRVLEKKDSKFVFGTVKALTPKYGISTLLRATALIRSQYPNIPIELRIAGKGEYEQQYKQMAVDLKIEDVTTWLGFISQDLVAVEWANMDIAVVPSEWDSESFGVSAVEAQACGTPVIITDIEGLKEATKPGSTSIVIPKGNEILLAEKLIELYFAPATRYSMGKEGRKFVQNHYEYNMCFKKVELIFYKNLSSVKD